MKLDSYWVYDFKTDEVTKISIEKETAQPEAIIASLPSGVYSTFRTIGKTRAFQLSAHFQRLIESLELSKQVFPYSFDQLRKPLKLLLEALEGEAHRVRLQIPLSDLSRCYLLVEPLQPYPPSVYKHGVSVKTNHLERNNPKAKLTDFVANSQDEKDFIKNTGLEESLILDQDSFILEGLSSNFFAMKNGRIWTASQNILEGITRKIILELAQESGIEILYSPVNYADLDSLQEAFISSTSRGVMPVVKIDSYLVGDGKPGRVTRQLMQAFDGRFFSEFEEI
jgi:branched-chain amino acid aminotransferase